MIKLKKIKKCEVCGSSNLLQVLNLGEHPLCDDLIPVDNKVENQKFPISIVFCEKCITAHQEFQVPKIDLFPKNYHYRSRFTADVLSGMEDLVNSVETKKLSLQGNVVLDIGCNDGSLLDKFKQKGATTIGVEPTGAYADAEGRNHVIYNDFFTEKTAKQILKNYPQIDVITFTNVFAHIEDLPGLLAALSTLINENTIVVIENHYLGAILNHNQFDTFYHEHPRTYSLNSFLHIAQSLNCKIISAEFPERYGGNIRVMIGKSEALDFSDPSYIELMLKNELSFLEKFKNMSLFIDKWKIEKKGEIMELVRLNGKLPAKAFPGRAAILIEMLKLSNDEIDCVYEKPKSPKINHYIPGTKIPINSDEMIIKQLPNIKVMLNLAWHISDEIENYLRKLGFKGQLVNIISKNSGKN